MYQHIDVHAHQQYFLHLAHRLKNKSHAECHSPGPRLGMEAGIGVILDVGLAFGLFGIKDLGLRCFGIQIVGFGLFGI